MPDMNTSTRVGIDARDRIPARQLGTNGAGVVKIHDDYWRGGGHVAEYASRSLFPPEVIMLSRYHDRLARGRVLEVGCGAGRVLGFLLSLCREVEGIDLAEDMLAYCRHTYPGCNVHRGDLGALRRCVTGPFDAVVAAFNVLDGFEDSERKRVLRAVRMLLVPDGLFMFSSHNYEAADERGPERSLTARLRRLSPERLPQVVRGVARGWINRRRLRPLEYRERDYGMLVDGEGDSAMLHYYIGHAAQERQLDETGYELLECIDIDGEVVPRSTPGSGPWLHYVARAA